MKIIISQQEFVSHRSFKYDGTVIQSTETPSLFGSGAWISEASTYTIDFPSGGSLSHNNHYIITSDSGSSLTMDSELQWKTMGSTIRLTLLN